MTIKISRSRLWLFKTNNIAQPAHHTRQTTTVGGVALVYKIACHQPCTGKSSGWPMSCYLELPRSIAIPMKRNGGSKESAKVPRSYHVENVKVSKLYCSKEYINMLAMLPRPCPPQQLLALSWPSDPSWLPSAACTSPARQVGKVASPSCINSILRGDVPWQPFRQL